MSGRCGDVEGQLEHIRSRIRELLEIRTREGHDVAQHFEYQQLCELEWRLLATRDADPGSSDHAEQERER